MSVGHALSPRWLTATSSIMPSSGLLIPSLRSSGLPYRNQSRRQLSTGHGRSSLPHAAGVRLGESTVGPRLSRRLHHTCRLRFSCLQELSHKAYRHGQLGVARRSAGLPGKPSQVLRPFSTDTTSEAATLNGLSDSHSVFETSRDARAVSGRFPFNDDDSLRFLSRRKYTLPEGISAKLCTGKTLAIYVPEGSQSSEMLEATHKHLHQLFTQSVETSHRRGLSCWAEALLQCWREIGSTDSFLIRPTTTPSISRLHEDFKDFSHGMRVYHYGFRTKQERSDVWLWLPHYVDIQSSVAGAVVESRSITINKVVLYGGIDEKWMSKKSTTQDIDTRREAAFLSSMARTVTKRVCGAMKFETVQHALSVIAETMLRVLKFRSDSIVLHTLRLRLRDSASETLYDTSATWKPSMVGAGDEVEITHVEVASDQDQQTDDLANDEVHEEYTDEIDVAAEAAVETLQGSPAGNLALSQESVKLVTQSQCGKTTELADDEHERVLSSSNFSARLQPHLNVPLRQNPLVFTSGDTKVLILEEFSSRRISDYLGFSSVKTKLVWSYEQWSIIGNDTVLDLARAIEDHLVLETKNSIASCIKAAKRLGEILPGEPEVRISLLITAKQRKDGHEGGAQIIFSSKHTDDIAHIVLPHVVIKSFGPDLLMDEPAQYLLVGVSLMGRFVALEGRDSASLPALHSIVEASEPFIRSVLKDSRTRDLQHAAGLIAAGIMDDPELSAGLVEVYEANSRIVPHVNHKDQRALRASVSRGPSDDAIFVALGSNVGDRVATIEDALRVLDGNENIKLLRTSPLYETEPMYVENQERFLNGMCKIETELNPIELLDTLQAVEVDLGRVKLIDKGPRNIDLDIVTFGRQTIESERLIVPHRLMLEREFVLRPLCDISKNFVHPQSRRRVLDHLSDLPPSSTPMYPLTPLAPGLDLRALDPGRKTMVMSILNVTPDSFSDGGVHRPADTEALKATVCAHITAGAKIIDIGGQSSRPNAPDISAEEEIARIVPAIEAIQSLPEAANVAISIDTYRAAVAEAAINAGAHIINDISAGMLDAEMLPTIARLGCTYVMMHMRGTPATMQNEENTSYPHGLIPTIIRELKERLQAAEEAGIRRWRIILDPGIGFAKTVEQNLEILRKLEFLRLRSDLRTYPWLVGSSRKGFIGKITRVENAAGRINGTAATVTAAVQGGAEIVRVHDVEEMVQVVKMADAMYRVP